MSLSSEGNMVYSWIKAAKVRRDKIFLAEVGEIIQRPCTIAGWLEESCLKYRLVVPKHQSQYWLHKISLYSFIKNINKCSDPPGRSTNSAGLG